LKIDGGCHCGHIKYEAEVDPDQVYLCHCTDCQAISGGAFRWGVPVAEAMFKLLAGEPKIYAKITGSGAMNHQLFCPECASPIYSTTIGAEPKVFNLRLGTARQRDDLQPKTQYWCRSSQPWAVLHGESDRFEKQ
jgi:hypothetical protein